MSRTKKKLLVLIPLLVLILLLAAGYLIPAIYFQSHFFPNTKVNGMDLGNKTADYLKKINIRNGEDYLLTVYDRDGNKYHLQGMDFNYAYIDSGEEQSIMEQQNAFAWPAEFKKEHTYMLNATYSYDEASLNQVISDLDLFHAEEYIAPENAALTLTEDGTYEITPEIYGNTPIEEEVTNTITQAVASGITEYTLEDKCYLAPTLIAEDEVLTTALATIDAYCNSTITYQIEGADEKLSSADISAMLVIGDDFSVSINEDKVAAYVQKLASTYNTYADVRSFKTTLGDIVEIGGGDYGWVVNKPKEAEQIMEDLKSGSPTTREPIYEQTAKQRGEDDIGDTYVELDYTNQHLYYYEAGTLILESDIVSGTMSNDNGSPDGVFKIVYKQSPAVLVGEDYESPVDYFMPFAYNVGIHDANWRKKFGGEIYRTAGSRGCINVPTEVAATLYQILEKGTPVIAYYREPVTLTSTSNGISNAYSYVKPKED